MKHSYHDKHGQKICAGMTIRSEEGDIELVYKISDEYGEDEDLGIRATNPDYIKNHPYCNFEYYTLTSIGARNWEIVQQPQTQEGENEYGTDRN